MQAYFSALLTAVFALVLTAVAYQNALLVVVVVVLVQLLIVMGPGATDDRGRSLRTPMALSILIASIISVSVSLFPEVLVGAGGSEVSEVGLIDTGVFSGVYLGLVGAFFTAVVAQMLRKDDRSHLSRTLGHTMLMSTLAVLSVGWIGAASVPPPGGVVAMASGAMALAVIIRQFVPANSLRFENIMFAGAVIVAAITSMLIGRAFDVPLSTPAAVILGGLSGYLALIGHRVADYVCKSLRHSGPRIGFAAAMPVALVGPLAFVASALPGI